MQRGGAEGPLPPALDKGLFDLVGYLLSSARGLLDEPAEYGPFRLMEAVSRLCGLMAAAGSQQAELLRRMQRAMDDGKLGVMGDVEPLARLLDQAVLEFTRALKQD